jgi:hypothetical protein
MKKRLPFFSKGSRQTDKNDVFYAIMRGFGCVLFSSGENKSKSKKSSTQKSALHEKRTCFGKRAEYGHGCRTSKCVRSWQFSSRFLNIITILLRFF